MSVKRLSRPYCPSAIAFIDSRSRQGLSPHIAISLKLSQPCALRLPYRMAGVLFYSPSQKRLGAFPLQSLISCRAYFAAHRSFLL
ncbi:hypothetical protein F7P05_08655 [Klebsiella pneumoniae]|nr:hypothetical protein F7P05_08655 [Klebsiella pneumoniae]